MRHLLLALLAAPALANMPPPTLDELSNPAPDLSAIPPVYTDDGLAIRGYDPVAYFQDSASIPGLSAYETTWQQATWRFASAEHLEAVKATPEAFAPQYGGYCAWAVSQGHTASIDPAAWKIVEGRLYLNYSEKIQEQWSADIPAHIARADANWPQLLLDLEPVYKAE